MSNLTKTITVYTVEKRTNRGMVIIAIRYSLEQCEELAQGLIDKNTFSSSQLRVCEKTVYSLDGSGWL